MGNNRCPVLDVAVIGSYDYHVDEEEQTIQGRKSDRAPGRPARILLYFVMVVMSRMGNLTRYNSSTMKLFQ